MSKGGKFLYLNGKFPGIIVSNKLILEFYNTTMKLVFSLFLCCFVTIQFPKIESFPASPHLNYNNAHSYFQYLRKLSANDSSINETKLPERFKRNYEPTMDDYSRERRELSVFMGNRGRRDDFQRMVRGEDVFLGNRGRRYSAFANDFLGSRGKKYEFMGNRGRRDEFLGSRGRRGFLDEMDDSMDRPRRYDEFLGSRGRRCDGTDCFEAENHKRKRRDLTEIDDNVNIIDDKHLKLVYLPKLGKKHFVDEIKEPKISTAKLFITYNDMSNIVKKSKSDQIKEKDIISHEPFWAHRGKKRTTFKNLWHENSLLMDDPYWVLISNDVPESSLITPLIVSRGKKNLIV